MKDSVWYECLNKDVLFFETNTNRRVCKNAVSRIVETQYPSSEDQITTEDQAQNIQGLPSWTSNQQSTAQATQTFAPNYGEEFYDYDEGFYDYDDIKEREAERVYIGKTLAEAQALARQRGETIRVTEQDDIDMPPARDFVLGRVKVELKRGIITEVDIEGYDD